MNQPERRLRAADDHGLPQEAVDAVDRAIESLAASEQKWGTAIDEWLHIRGRLQVEPWVLLYAFRYGLGRATGAHGDVLALVKRHWEVLTPYRDSILEDLRRAIANPHPVQSREEVEEAQELAMWIEEQ